MTHAIPHTTFKVKRSKVNVTGLLMLTQNVPLSSTCASQGMTSGSKVMVTRSRDLSDTCWPIIRDRIDVETPRLVIKFITSRATLRTSFKLKSSKVKVTMPINAGIITSEREGLGNPILVHRWSTKTRITHKHHDLKGQGRKVTPSFCLICTCC